MKKTEKIELANFKKKLRYIPCSLFKVHGNEMHSFVTQALQDSPLVAGCGTKFSLKIFEIVSSLHLTSMRRALETDLPSVLRPEQL